MPESGSPLSGILYQNGSVELVAGAAESASVVTSFESGTMSAVFDLHLEQGVLLHHWKTLDSPLASKDLSYLYPPRCSLSLL